MKDNKVFKAAVIWGIVLVIAAACAIGYVIYRKASVKEIAIGLSDIELTDELKAEVKNTASEAQKYIEANRQDRTLTSQYGLLYSYKDKANVLPSEVIEDIKLPADTQSEMDILYISPTDVDKITQEPAFGANSQMLSAMVSVNTKEGYYVADPMGNEALLSEEEMKNLLLSYSPAHGQIVNPPRNSEAHTAIITAANIQGANFDIKHIACDDKYAVVVANDVNNPADIREYALKNENGWHIMGDSLAKDENSYITVNTAAPDMDMGLMPIYNIASFDAITTDKISDVADSLIGLGSLTEADKQTMYACSCGRFVYIEPQNGKKLVGYIDDDGKLNFNEAENINEVIAYMLSCSEDPPVFIAKFE